MDHIPRRRLGSAGESAPPSESSEGTSSETCDVNQDWSSDAHQNTRPLFNPNHHQEQHHQTRLSSNGLFINSDPDIAGDNMSIETTTSSPALTEYERGQVESFFGGLGTHIFVSSSLANLYEGIGKDDWRLVFTGIPVVLHDRGSARSRAMPRVTLCLAERGSSFALWSDRIDNLSNYRVAGPSFHTMCLSSNHQQMIGFSFDAVESARELCSYIEKLISDPENIALSVPGRKKQQKQKRPKPAPLPPKSQISHPCQFHHVTSVTKEDTDRYYSMQAFAPSSLKHR